MVWRFAAGYSEQLGDYCSGRTVLYKPVVVQVCHTETQKAVIPFNDCTRQQLASISKVCVP